ncbi:MAG: plastocyanin/azurin family copper-binding protein [Chloroflexota bacterium]|nr:plastocyanin/azurin family copper-binding protein [Chloroflexota bacterium]
MHRFLGPASLSLALACVLACSGSAGSNRQPAPSAASAANTSSQSVTVQGTDTFKFDPPTMTVKAGEPVQLTFKNTGQILHDWSLAQGAAQPVKIEAAGGQSASGTFTIDKPGTYTYICAQPGHESAGMKGTITVQ